MVKLSFFQRRFELVCNPLYLALKFKLHCCQNYVFGLNFSLATSEKKLHLTTDYWLIKFSICFCKRLQGTILGKYAINRCFPNLFEINPHVKE